MTVLNPSLSIYKHLQDLHPSSLKCPCLNVMVSFSTFITLSPTLHQVCSSDYVSESWMLLLSYFEVGELGSPFTFWNGLGARHFQLLSSLCQLANQTITDAIHHLGIQFVISADVFTESDFNNQSNTTLIQFIQSIIIDFNLIVDTVHLFTQVDQPYTRFDNADIMPYNMTNENNGQQSLQVLFHAANRSTLFCIN
jgi:hypothetical protein